MPKRRLRMRQIKEILRLKHELNCSQETIAQATGIARSTVRDYLSRACVANVCWPLPETMTNEQLNELLFPPVSDNPRCDKKKPDWALIHTELKRKAVTLQLLWEEYKRANPGGYQYSWFAHLYRIWAKAKDVWMPQIHKAGEKAFVDYSGLTVPIYATNLQEILYKAEIFVGVLGASDLIYCEATKSQCLPDWISAHQSMLRYYNGVPALLVPDNLRSGVTKAHRYEPLCNITYEEFAQHYHCAVMPARSRHPKDKSKAEKSVQLVQQRILAPERDTRFTSLEQLNIAIEKRLETLNHRDSKTLGSSRWALFHRIESAQLKPLPARPYELATWQKQLVNGGYHVCVNRHHYSVPHVYVRKRVEIRITIQHIEIFYHDARIACHTRDDTPRGYTTVEAHRPEAHRQHAIWQSHDRLRTWAQSIGPHTQALITRLFDDQKRHLYQKERSALGILRLSHAFSDSLLELACKRAGEIGTYRYDSLISILKRHRLEQNKTETHQTYQTPEHANVRGADYYH
jgi:transposase